MWICERRAKQSRWRQRLDLNRWPRACENPKLEGRGGSPPFFIDSVDFGFPPPSNHTTRTRSTVRAKLIRYTGRARAQLNAPGSRQRLVRTQSRQPVNDQAQTLRCFRGESSTDGSDQQRENERKGVSLETPSLYCQEQLHSDETASMVSDTSWYSCNRPRDLMKHILNMVPGSVHRVSRGPARRRQQRQTPMYSNQVLAP